MNKTWISKNKKTISNAPRENKSTNEIKTIEQILEELKPNKYAINLEFSSGIWEMKPLIDTRDRIKIDNILTRLNYEVEMYLEIIKDKYEKELNDNL